MTKETQDKWFAENKEKIKEYKKEWYEKNKERILKERKLYRIANVEVIKEKSKRWRECHKERIRKKDKEYQQKNRKNLAITSRKYNLRINYNMTLEDYEKMSDLQNGKCAICGEKKELHVDHDHETGMIRGLLCGNCNRAIGIMKDDKNLLIKAIEYLCGVESV